MPGRDDGRAPREPTTGRSAGRDATGREPSKRDTTGRETAGPEPTVRGTTSREPAKRDSPGRDTSSREPAGRARPTGSRDRAAGQQRRPSTARRPVRAARGSTVRSIRVHGLLGLASTRRAAVLALVVCALVLSVAVPLRNYLAQRGALEDTVRQQDTLREQVDELERRRTQLSDPAQIEVEARNRLRYVRPGETPYVVQLPTPTPPPAPTDAPRSAEGQQWYGEMWKSIAGQDGGG